MPQLYPNYTPTIPAIFLASFKMPQPCPNYAQRDYVFCFNYALSFAKLCPNYAQRDYVFCFNYAPSFAKLCPNYVSADYRQASLWVTMFLINVICILRHAGADTF